MRPCWLGAWRIAALHFASRTQNRVVFRVALEFVKKLSFIEKTGKSKAEAVRVAMAVSDLTHRCSECCPKHSAQSEEKVPGMSS